MIFPAAGWRCGTSAGVKPDDFQPAGSGDEPHSADPGSAGNPGDTKSEQGEFS